MKDGSTLLAVLDDATPNTCFQSYIITLCFKLEVFLHWQLKRLSHLYSTDPNCLHEKNCCLSVGNQGKLQSSSAYQKRKNINTSDVPSLRFCPLRRWFLLGRVAVLRTKMRPIVTDRVVWFVGLSDTVVPCKNG